MPSNPTDTEPQSWHRHFAIASNNRAWDLAAVERTPQEELEMINAAHASSWHCSVVGTELHVMRSKMLLARVHTLAGHGPYAFALAREVRDYFLFRESPDWELAFVHSIYAHAAQVVGDAEGHRLAYEKAVAALAAVRGEEDRALVRETLDRVLAP